MNLNLGTHVKQRRWLLVGLVLLAAAVPMAGTEAAKNKPAATFQMVRSAVVVGANCLPKAKATVKLFRRGAVEKMTISAQGLPKNKEFDVFIIQQPDAPFGVSWYQGDFQTDKDGKGTQSYVGRFSIETFAVAPGPVAVPDVDDLDQNGNNPAFNPIHTLHVGMWFNRPQDAANAGCPNTVTPFNGDHNAGIQVLKTNVQQNGLGPLARLGS